VQTAPAICNDRLSEAADSQPVDVISIYSNASGFECLRPEWEALRQQSDDQDPFLSCDWFESWWRAFGGQRKLLLVTARRHGHLRAILPMMLERTWHHGIPLRRLVAIGNDHTPHFDLVRARDDKHLHRSIWNHLMALRSEWDVLDFPRMSAESSTTDHFVRLATEQDVQYSLWQQAPRSPWVDIQSSWDDYLDLRSANFRKSLRRKMRRLVALGRVDLETVTGHEGLDQALAEGMHIEAEGWKGSNKTAISSQPAVAGFYTELAGIMAARGQLRLHFLTLDDVRIAFDYSIIANRCLYSLKAGHSSAYARFSPGTVMLGLILQRAHEEGLVGMDLLGESDEFKMHWTDVTRTHQWLHCYSDSRRGRLLHTLKCRLLPIMTRLWAGHDGR
jgi:CelD/BcsL family acetyltransferase involved in cellulose biosynthesis